MSSTSESKCEITDALSAALSRIESAIMRNARGSSPVCGSSKLIAVVLWSQPARIDLVRCCSELQVLPNRQRIKRLWLNIRELSLGL